MQALPTVLLRHVSRQGTHYDWLLANPHDPQGLLWAARCEYPSSIWASLGAWRLEPIANHRRVYLEYQGRISGGRGWVQRVDRGTFVADLWSESRRVIEVSFEAVNQRIELYRLGRRYWKASLV